MYRLPEDEATEVVGGCYVRCASAVEDTPRGTILNMGKSCDGWVKPRERGRCRFAPGRWRGSGCLLPYVSFNGFDVC